MNKKERAEYDRAIETAEILGAFHFTAPVQRDVQPPSGQTYTEGWDFNSYTATVWRAWSGSVSHGEGPAPLGNRRFMSGSQGCRSMFSSKVLALRALRHEMELKYAKELLKVDKQIREANAGE